MLVGDLFDTQSIRQGDIHVLKTHCSRFIQESVGLPVFRALPSDGNDFRRVKVRYHKRSDSVSELFNTALESVARNIVPRGIFTQPTVMEHQEGYEPFYVFPVNGYRFLYSKGVQNSNMNFRTMMTELEEKVDGAHELTRDLIKYTYVTENLEEGIHSGSEIIFFNIPSYYAVKCSAVKSYSSLINTKL